MNSMAIEEVKLLETDGTILFFQQVLACQLACGAKRILDFGAGRGASHVDATNRGLKYKAFLTNLGSLGAHVTACDIDSAVKQNRTADEIVLIGVDDRLPFADASFDLIVSDNTFEHIEKPSEVSRELLRVLRPGGLICARTPNRFGYIALAASFAPPSLYGRLLRRAQPDRQEHDKFEVHYHLNSSSDIKRHFPDSEIHIRYPNFEPSYYFGSKLIKKLMIGMHYVLPKRLRTAIIITIQKR